MGRGGINEKNNITEVKSLQDFLKSKGYFSATPNGVFGPMTQNAVKKFQKANNIRQIGTVGPITIKVVNNCAS